jgi:hypothetical protein
LATERDIIVHFEQGVLWSDTPVVVTGERHTNDVFFGDVALPGARLANPAAVFCEVQGGTVSGPEPMCALPDGTVVDAWEHFRSRLAQSPTE